MAIRYSDQEIASLVQDRKPLPADWRNRARVKLERGHCEQQLNLSSVFSRRDGRMSMESIERDFHEEVSAKIRLSAEGVGRFRVSTPFLFDDGDHLSIVLKKEGSRWVLSDEAHTYMRLTYDVEESDLHQGARQQIISNILSTFRVEDRDGELMIAVPDDRYGDALYSFVQALLKIAEVSSKP